MEDGTYIPLRHRPLRRGPAQIANQMRILPGDGSPEAIRAEEARIAEMEAANDRVQTIRDETNKATARQEMERPRTGGARDATEPQLKFIRDLMRDRAVTPNQQARCEELVDSGVVTFAMASNMIDKLKEYPYRSGNTAEVAPAMPHLPPGRYAVIGEDGTVDFYKIDIGTKGRWDGFLFLDHVQGPNEVPVKNRQTKTGILRKIAQDPAEASKRYGRELGHCGVCGTQLTNDTSRELGIGPVCRKNMGW